MKILLLTLLTYQPPLRTSFYSSAKFILNIDDNDDIRNFLYIDVINNKCFFIINDDKASNYPTYKNNKKLSIIPIINIKLNDILINSFKNFNRTYLFKYNEHPLISVVLFSSILVFKLIPSK